MPKKGRGWHGQPRRHSEAAKIGHARRGLSREELFRREELVRPHKADIVAASSYVRGIRNMQKKAYAADYLIFLLVGGKKLKVPEDLSYMGAQAVRMNLEDILKVKHD